MLREIERSAFITPAFTQWCSLTKKPFHALKSALFRSVVLANFAQLEIWFDHVHSPTEWIYVPRYSGNGSVPCV